MIAETIGIDIGGANLKVASASGHSLAAPFELWRHPERLASALQDLVNQLGCHVGNQGNWSRVGITMTGELCDCFQTKQDGVSHILAAVRQVFGNELPQIWTTGGEWMTIDQACAAWEEVAAANWHAQATFAGRLVPNGNAILIDTGSTTTDVIPLRDGRPVATGLTDPTRLTTSELVYTGARRTPVCALLEGVAAEWFATSHDAYVLMGVLPEMPEYRGTADGRPMTVANAHARLSRMLGGDPVMTSRDDTLHLARRTKDRQVSLIANAIAVVAERLNGTWTAILSGSGEFLPREAVTVLKRQPVEVHSLSEKLGKDRSEGACAYSVAIMLSEA